MAYDSPIPGFNTYNTNNLRLWRSRPRATFDFDKFNSSDYAGAIREKQEAEAITSVLQNNLSLIEQTTNTMEDNQNINFLKGEKGSQLFQ